MAERKLSLLAAAAASAGTAGALALAWTWWARKARGQLPEAATAVPLPLTVRTEWLRAPAGDRPRVVLLATGSVASVKVPQLAAALCEFAEVAVVLTASGRVMVDRVANRYAPKWVLDCKLLQKDGQLRVFGDEDEWDGYESVAEDPVLHIELRKWADVAVLAPCSANSLAKVALGLCDNLATCVLRAWNPDKPVIVAPAMNTVMWEHPTTAQHLSTLASWGYKILPPACKRLACGDEGRGALPAVADVAAAARDAARGFAERRSCSEGYGAWERRGFKEWTPLS